MATTSAAVAWGKPIIAENEIKEQKYISLSSIMDETLALKLQDEEERQEYVMLDVEEDLGCVPLEDDAEQKRREEEDASLALALQLQAQEEADYDSRQDRWVYNPQKYKDLLGLEDYAKDTEESTPRGDWYKNNEGEYMSKHDIKKASRKNAAELERQYDIPMGDDISMPHRAFNKFKETLRRDKVKGIKTSGPVEAAKRATSEAVLDARTRLIVAKLLNRGELDEMHGVIRTGKEANVYSALYDDCSSSCAVKIFKTTLTAFRNRSEYVIGDNRFDQGYDKKSLLRQINDWSKKEFANLCRAYKAGLPVPTPMCFKEHVLVMSFVGSKSWPAPQLREVELTESQQRRCYAQIIAATRHLYQEARLVHADLSPYNILYFRKKCWLIDFGQAVDISHPRQSEYLERDIRNINDFFKGLDQSDRLTNETYIKYVVSEEPSKSLLPESMSDLIDECSSFESRADANP